MQTVIIIVLALSLAILSVCHVRQGKLSIRSVINT